MSSNPNAKKRINVYNNYGFNFEMKVKNNDGATIFYKKVGMNC